MVIAVYLTNGEGAVIMTLEALVGLGFELEISSAAMARL
jgi:hypothetical protein